MLNTCAAVDVSADALEQAPDLEAIERELAELSAHLDAATHRQLELIRAVDESGHWHQHGATSCAHWLSWRVGLNLGAARERVRVGRALAGLPAIDEGLKRGRISYSKVRAMSRVATPRNEEMLLDMALHSTASQLERVCRGLRSQQVEDASRKPKSEPFERWVRLRHRGAATVRLEGELLPDETARVMEALRLVSARMAVECGADRKPAGSGEKPSLADALVRMADEVLAARACVSEGDNEGSVPEHAAVESEGETRPATQSPATQTPATQRSPSARTTSVTRTTGANRAEILVHFGPDALNDAFTATLDDGARVSAETFRRLACDCGLVGVARGNAPDGAAPDGIGPGHGGDVLDVGRKTRRIPPSIRRAVMARDRGCTFPGCTHDRFIDIHHAEHWVNGGETKVANLVALCTFHHTLIHEGGFASS